MKKILLLACFGLAVPMLHAQSTNEVDDLKRQLQEMRENFDRVQREQREQIDSLNHKLDELIKQQQVQSIVTSSPPMAAAPAEEKVTPGEFQALDAKVEQVIEAQKKSLLSEFNPAIGVVGETIFSYTSKGSDQTGSDRPGGFDVWQRSVELNLAASVDPFAKGYVVANATADSATGDASLEVEEAAIETTSLPWNLSLKAGLFFAEFGRLAYVHDHELPFVNRPLVLDQYIGGESKTAGAQINWLLPTEHYVSLTAGFGDQFGDDPDDPGTYRSLGELNYWSRLSTYFDLTPNWQLETGVSGLINPSTAGRGGSQLQPNGVSTLTEQERRLAGLDLKLSYVPLRDNEYRGLVWGTEFLASDNRYRSDPDGTPANGDEFDKTIGSLGLYSYVTYKWSRQWSGGFLFDWVQNDQNSRDETFAYSPYLTFAFSHWNQLRLQYTHTDPGSGSGYESSDAIYLQWAWIIGAHSHGWQQR